MSKNYELNEKGQIKDTDPLYDTLDVWHDEDEYDKILETIYAIPREQWSNKLWFRVISALNNKGEFTEAKKEIGALNDRCETPAEMAKLFYMLGYIFYKSDQEYKAIECYQNGMREDPEDTANLNLQAECDDCMSYITKSLNTLSDLANTVKETFSGRISEKSDKYDLSDEDFTMLLAFLPTIRKIPQIDRCLGIDDYFLKYSDNEKEDVLEYLQDWYNIHDKESFIEALQESNFGNRYNDIVAYLNGTPNFSLDQLSPSGMTLWNASMDFAKQIQKHVPDGGIYAWDISERIYLTRVAYSCDIIGNTDYCSLLLQLTDEAKEKYHSWEEYLIGLVFGAGYYMFCMSNLSLTEAIEFICSMAPLLINSDIPDSKWIA